MIAFPVYILRAFSVEKSVKTNKVLFEGCLIALDEIPDVLQLLFLSGTGKSC